MRASFDEHDVTLRTDLPLDSAPLVAADATRMSHVFSNLLRNALRFTAAGGSVTCSVAAEANEVRFSVTDTGAGIPPQYLGRVFDKFFRAPGQPGDTGSGLGLAIVKDIVEAHGGRIFVESTEGHGTTFTFTLPVARAAPGTAPPRLPANEPRAASSERVAP